MILNMLRDYINENPDQRFGQALVNLGITIESSDHPEFYKVHEVLYNEEPQQTLERIDETFKRIMNNAKDND